MTMYPVQQSFNGGEISPLLTARTDQPRYQTGAILMKNAVPMAQGPVTRRPGFYFMGAAKEQDSTKTVRLVPFVFSSLQSRILEFGDGYVRVWISEGLVATSDGDVYEVESPYTDDDISGLRFAQSSDVVYIVSPNHPPRKLSRYADDDWRFETPTFMPTIDPPSDVSITTGGTVSSNSDVTATYYYRVSTISATTGEESLASDIVSIESTGLSSSFYNRLSWTAVDGALQYRIYKKSYGVYGFIGRAIDGDTYFDDTNIGADEADTVSEAENPFAEEGDYPSIVFFWQQRLGFASTNNNPLTVWFSESGNLESMAASSPANDDDKIEATLAAQRQNIFRWIEGDRVLCLGTDGGEWTMEGSSGGAITPSSMAFSSYGNRGSESLPALTAGDSLLFVQRGGNVVREFAYSYDYDAYIAADLTLLSGVLQGRRIVAWAFQQSPYAVAWCVLDNGSMAGLTYLREHDVVGWHRHETDGFVEDVAVIPTSSATGQNDEVWLLVRRTVDGVEKRYVERMAEFFDGDTADAAFYVDSGLTYEGDAVTSLSGLSHLEGRTVSIFADGYVMPPRIVADGTIKLDRAASTVHVGLPYNTDIIPTKPESTMQNGTTISRVRKVSGARLRLYQSMGVRAGMDENSLYEILVHDAAAMVSPKYMTGDCDVSFDSGWSEDAKVLVRVQDPTPMTLLSIVYDVDISSTSGGQV
ncbi:MAG: hypothetical protein R3Y11_03915 [Pseudomonadota bacterium]